MVFLQETERYRVLRPEHEVPEQDRAEEETHRDRHLGPRSAEERRDHPPQQQVDDRPEPELDHPGRRVDRHVEVAADDRQDPMPRTLRNSHPLASCAIDRNVSSRSSWPYRAAISAGAPSATARPAARKITRLHRRSISAMLWEVIR